MAWGIEEAWPAAVVVAAAAHGVSEDALRAPSRGRGYKPPPRVATARKSALYLTVLVTGCGYAELAAHLGFHKDTVHSHCKEMERQADVDRVELASERLERLVRQRLIAGRRSAIELLEARIEELRAAEAIAASSDDTSALIRQDAPDHANVIELPKKRVSA